LLLGGFGDVDILYLPGLRFHTILKLPSDSINLIISTYKKKGEEYHSFHLFRADFKDHDQAPHIIWQQPIYQKKGQFTPWEILGIEYDSLDHNLFTFYDIPNDSAITHVISSRNIITGEANWETVFSLPADFAIMNAIGFDSTHVYLTGENRATTRKHWNWLIERTGMGVLVQLNKSTGEEMKFKFFGEGLNYSDCNFKFIHSDGLKLQVIGWRDYAIINYYWKQSFLIEVPIQEVFD